MTRSASTLTFHLTKTALELAGYPQPKFSLDAIAPQRKINFVQNISDNQADEIKALVHELGYPIVLKTHTRPNPAVVKMVQNGDALAHAIYRDPRDMALSMMEHGVKSRANGKPAFQEIETLEDALKGIRNQTDSLTAWLRLPRTMPLYFDDIIAKTEQIAERILDHLKIPGNPKEISRVALKKRFALRNNIRTARHISEMSTQNSERIATEFAPLFDSFVKNRNDLPRDGRILLPAPTHLRISASE